MDRQRQALERKRAALQRSLEAAGEPGELRAAGEAVLACISTIEPGQEILVFNDRQVRLDPELSPIDNAQEFFRRYRKAKDAARRVPQLLQQTELQLQQLDDLSALAEASDNPSRLRAIGEELAELRSRDGRRTAPGAAQVGSKRVGRRIERG